MLQTQPQLTVTPSNLFSSASSKHETFSSSPITPMNATQAQLQIQDLFWFSSGLAQHAHAPTAAREPRMPQLLAFFDHACKCCGWSYRGCAHSPTQSPHVGACPVLHRSTHHTHHSHTSPQAVARPGWQPVQPPSADRAMGSVAASRSGRSTTCTHTACSSIAVSIAAPQKQRVMTQVEVCAHASFRLCLLLQKGPAAMCNDMINGVNNSQCRVVRHTTC